LPPHSNRIRRHFTPGDILQNGLPQCPLACNPPNKAAHLRWRQAYIDGRQTQVQRFREAIQHYHGGRVSFPAAIGNPTQIQLFGKSEGQSGGLPQAYKNTFV